MLFRLVRPMRRRGSSNQQFVQRIPADVRHRAVGRKLAVPVGSETAFITITAKTDAIRFSLRTSEPSEAKIRQATAAGYLEAAWRALRTECEPVRLSHKQAVSLSGELYNAWSAERAGERTIAVQFMPDGSSEVDREPHLASEAWEAVLQSLERDESTDVLEGTFGPLVDRLLLQKGIASATPQSRAMLLSEFHRALKDAIAYRQRNAGGDYSADLTASRFPAWSGSTGPAVSLKGLVEEWWGEAKASGRAQSTYESYRSTVARLSNFLKHDDAAAVTPADMVAFKDHRLAQGLSPKTVADSDLAGLRAVFGWAVDNLKLQSNPAEKTRIKRTKASQTRSKSFTPTEAAAILRHSAEHAKGHGEKSKTFAAKRWIPWLCAYTGARLGEMVQLRKQDMREEKGVWVITITPEAGTVKDKTAREVVLHQHLVEQGFPAFVQASKEGHLFIDPRQDGEIRGVWRSLKNRLREFSREVVTDAAVAPNHGWRHLFKTIGREAGIADSVLDAICGHAPRSVGGSYGGVTLTAQREAMARFPRFDIREPE